MREGTRHDACCSPAHLPSNLGKLKEVCSVGRMRRLRDTIVNEIEPVLQKVTHIKIELRDCLRVEVKLG